ncbi:MAG TPA: hypothetical protein VGN12_00740 [Pirellulales bacterium]|jgi:hypothetical protein
MKSVDRALDFLECQTDWRYSARTTPAAEPTAWAALALAAYGRHEAAARARVWLLDLQNTNGSVGIRKDEPAPCWPTGLAVLAWKLTGAVSATNIKSIGTAPSNAPSWAEQEGSRRAVEWLLTIAGETSANAQYTGHDTSIAGWPWVVGTHSWVEPSALALLALRAAGLAEHPRARDAARLLYDRLLSTGGCNYGNTIVLGQALLPHVEPTGLTLLALAGRPDAQGRIAASIAYLQGTLGPETTPASLAYGLLGLAAQRTTLAQSDEWLSACVEGSYRRGASLELALLALAAMGSDCPLVAFSTNHQAA